MLVGLMLVGLVLVRLVLVQLVLVQGLLWFVSLGLVRKVFTNPFKAFLHSFAQSSFFFDIRFSQHKMDS